MRKNGVNKKLTPISGGVCAPQGFAANGIYCELPPSLFMDKQVPRENFAIIRSDKRCPTACVYGKGALVGAPVKVTRKHLSSGYGRAVVVTSGIANVNGVDGEKQAQTLSRVFAKHADVLTEETVIASTGEMGKPFPLESFLENTKRLAEGLGKTEEKGLAAARAIMTNDNYPKQFAYAFELGAYPCKIGGICKGTARVHPSMATTLCFLTTDACVSPQMLQRALTAAVRDTFNLLDIDGISSPNDTVCIMANGLAGNYCISEEDTEYKKFYFALEQTLARVCKMIAEDGTEKAFSCYVTGAVSKSAARNVARTVVSSLALKREVHQATSLLIENLLCAVNESGEEIRLDRAEISLHSSVGKIFLFEDGKAKKFLAENAQRILNGNDAELRIFLGNGNYSAQAYGRACR